MRMKYTCGKKALIGFIVLAFSLMVFVSSGVNMVGDVAFSLGGLICVAVPVYYNYFIRRYIWILDGDCCGYIEHDYEICGFIVNTSAGDIPVIGERYIPIKGIRVRVFLKMKRRSFKEAAISSVYSFERIDTALAK